jgi:hypothetical protein
MPKRKKAVGKSDATSSLTTTNTKEDARNKLDRLWSDAQGLPAGASLVPAELKERLEQIFQSRTKTYQYAVITQLLAKLDDPVRDARCIQKMEGESDPSRFDARSLCSKVVLPWERESGSPLGLKDDPYVNNPMLVPDFALAYQHKQKDKKSWGLLVALLDHVQEHPDWALPLLTQALLMVRLLREGQEVKFPTPQRASLQDTLSVTHGFLKTKSGGARLQVVGFAVFDAIRKTWGIFDEVTTAPVNASNSSSGKSADVVCRRAGKVVLACEVKDRDLNIEMLHGVITNARLEKVNELFMLIRGKDASHDQEMTTRIDREFKHGMNVYLLESDSFLALVLALIGESGRQHFLRSVVEGMEMMNLPFESKRDWAKLLEAM